LKNEKNSFEIAQRAAGGINLRGKIIDKYQY